MTEMVTPELFFNVVKYAIYGDWAKLGPPEM